MTETSELTARLRVHWYPVVDDTIGGWAISNVDLPVSELDTRGGQHFTVGDFLSEDVARHICELHNGQLHAPACGPWTCRYPEPVSLSPGAEWTCPECGTRYQLTKPKQDRWWRSWSAPHGHWKLP